MKDVRDQIKRERHSPLEAKRCQCGAWFTIKGRRDRDRCFKCEQQEGQGTADQ